MEHGVIWKQTVLIKIFKRRGPKMIPTLRNTRSDFKLFKELTEEINELPMIKYK